MIPAEKSIYDAMQEVESLGCHIRLTDAVNLLGQARDAVADWAEETGNIRPESAPQDATASPCPPYQQRVLDEKAALDEKIDKLDIFRAGAIFPTLPTDEQNRLNLQLSFMRSYSGVLTDRINAWTVDGAPQPATGAGEEQA
jgi:hypothetical protein